MLKKPVKSVEGYIVFLSGLGKDTEADSFEEVMAEYGEVKRVHLNLDHRTTQVKGYALVEYAFEHEARQAIERMEGRVVEGNKVKAGWAYKQEVERT